MCSLRCRASGDMRTGVLFDLGTLAHASDVTFLLREVLDLARVADDLGFDTLLVGADHPKRLRWASIVSLVGALAGETAGARVGTYGLDPTEDHPVRIAEGLAVTDLLSSGRLVVGVRSASGDGTDRFTEALTLLLNGWSGTPFRFSGRYFSFPAPSSDDLRASVLERPPWVPDVPPPWRLGGRTPDYLAVTPRPVQFPGPPIWLCEGSIQSADMARSLGLPLLIPAVFGPKDAIRASDLHQKNSRGKYFAPEVGLVRDIHITNSGLTRREAEEVFASYRGTSLAGAADPPWIVGDVQEVSDVLRRWRLEVEIAHLFLRIVPGATSPEVSLRTFKLFQAEVWPRIQGD